MSVPAYDNGGSASQKTLMYDPTGILLQGGHHHTPHGPMGPHGGGAGGAGVGFPFGPLWFLLTIAILVGGAYLALRLLQDGETDTGRDDALAILEQRYARGEIDEEEFEKRRNQLARDRHC